MDDKTLATLDSNLEKFENKQIDTEKMGTNIVKFVGKCTDFDDVETLIFYCLKDDSPTGLAFAIDVAEKALTLKSTGKLSVVRRNRDPISKCAEYLIIARAFTNYQGPNSSKFFTKVFKLAQDSAKDSFDYFLLAGNLFDACGNLEDPKIDLDYKLTRSLISKATDLAVKENNGEVLDHLVSLAEDSLNDKELAKSIKSLKKKRSK